MDMQELAKQLRTPEGALGIAVGNNMSVGNASMYKLALLHLNLQADEMVLEAGFGNGKLIPSILNAAPGISYKGIDISPLMVQEAATFLSASEMNLNAEVLKGSISSIPFADNTFDAMLTVNTLYFLEHPVSDLKEILRVLKQEGRLVLAFRPKKMVEKLPFTKFGFTLYELDSVKKMLREAGFNNISEGYWEDAPSLFLGEHVAFSCYAIKAYK